MDSQEITEVFIPQDKDTICRFCLNLSNNLLFIHSQRGRIKWPKAGYISVQEILTKLTIEVDDTECLPDGICEKCRSILEDFYIFLEKIETNEQLLKNIYLYDEIDEFSVLDEKAEMEDSNLYEVDSDNNSTINRNNGKQPFATDPSIIKIEHAYGKKDEISIHHNVNENVMSENDLTPDVEFNELSNFTSVLPKTEFEEFNDEEEQITIIAEGDDSEETTMNEYKKVDTEFGKYKVYNTPEDVVKIRVINRKKQIIQKKIAIKKKVVMKKTLPTLEPEDVCIKQCLFCPKKFSNDDLRIIHYIDHVIQETEGMVPHRPFCIYCGLLTITKEELEEHIELKHNNDDNLYCLECDIKFSNISEVTSHEEKNHMENYEDDISTVIKCPVCEKEYESVEDLIQHSLIHISRRYTCMTCKELYVCESALNEHHKRHPNYKYRCHICKKLASGKRALEAHVGTHNTTRNYECDKCGKRYKTKHHLLQHRGIHFRPNLTCQFCDYSTAHSKDFIKHKRIHSDERPFQCTFSLCGKAFKTNSALSTHVKQHLKIKEFACAVCEYKTSTSVSLNLHMRKHTGERPFTCSTCLKTFNRRWSLTLHMRKVHNCQTKLRRGGRYDRIRQ